MAQGPTDAWDSAFLMISSIYVVLPRTIDPLGFVDLDGGFLSNSIFFFLVIHKKKIPILFNLYTIVEKWAGEKAFFLLVRRFLPLIFNTQFFATKGKRNKRHHSQTLSPETTPKMLGHKADYLKLTSNFFH